MDIRVRCGGDGVQSYLPREIVEEILANLPVKSLMRFRCVSKSWCSLIDTKIFMKKHLHNSKGRAVVKEYCSIIDDISRFPFNEPNNDDLLEGGSIIGCCNGVLCILNKGRFFLSNPATRIFVALPVFDILANAVVGYGWKEVRCGFGWDEESDAYKVFVITSNDENGVSLGKVYSSKTNSWKNVECGRVSYCGATGHYNVGVLASGKIHWVPEREGVGRYNYVDCIEYFDLKSEVFGRMKLPSEPEGGVGRWWLRERDGCLYALYNHNDDVKGAERSVRGILGIILGRERREREEEVGLFDVWVMEEYGMKESWVKKKTNIPILKFTLKYQQYVYVESLISPACDVVLEDEICPKLLRRCFRRRDLSVIIPSLFKRNTSL